MKNILPLFLLVFLCLSGCDKESEDRLCGCAPLNQSPCGLSPKAGPCDAAITKYYFDWTEKKCKEFTWGGCEGVVPFDTMEECLKCEQAAAGQK